MSKFFLLCCVLFWAGSLAAQDVPNPPAPSLAEDQTQFEETHLIYANRDVFGIHFYFNGLEVSSDQQLEDILATVDDQDTLARFRSGEDKASVGWVFIAGGSGMAITGGVLSWQGNGGGTATNILVLAGLSVDVLGGFLWREAQMDQLSAVDRYNALTRQQNGFSLLDLKGQGTGLAWVQRF